MAAIATPFGCFVGLVSADTGTEVTMVSFGNYRRQPATMVLCADGVTIANLAAVEWQVAKRDWGPIDQVQLWDSPFGTADTAVMFAGTFPTATVVDAAQYTILRIPPAGIAGIQAATPPRPYGTGAYGIGPYSTNRGLLLSGDGVLLEITFDRSGHVCEPGEWSPGPFQRAA
jgi:hypothetical protein